MKRWIVIGSICFATSVVAAPEDEFDRGYALAEKKGCLKLQRLVNWVLMQ
jgi:hypothetical protein